MTMPAVIDAKDLENKTASWEMAAAEIEVVDQESLDLVRQKLQAVKALRKEIEDFCDPNIKRWLEGHRAAVADKKRMLAPLDLVDSVFRGKAQVFLEAENRRQLEEQAKAAREAREREEKARAEAAELAKMNEHEMAQLALAEAEVVAVPAAVAPVAKSIGLGRVEKWQGEVTNLRALVEAIAKGEAELDLVMGNQTVINGLARSLKSAFNKPGIRVWDAGTIRVG